MVRYMRQGGADGKVGAEWVWRGRRILTTADLGEVGELPEGLAVAEGHEDEAVVDEGGEEVDDSRLLAAAGGARRDEHGHVLARERALRPELARRIEERLRARQSRSRNERRENAP